MKKYCLTALFFTLASASLGADLNWEFPDTKTKVDQKIGEVESEIHQGPSWEWGKYQVPDWYRNAKFGIFIHWGLYSVPAYANEWYSRNMYQQGDDAFKHHVATFGPQDKFGYKDFIPMFKADHFDPGHWAKLFKEAGARYVVPVAEHHDGFAMYDSDFSDWTAVKKGPHRDLIGELAQAVRKEGLVFGLSSHRAEHWWFMNGGMKFPSDVQDPKYADFYGPAMPDDTAPSEDYLRNWLARSAELVDKYHPQLVYFDWWIGERPEFKPYLLKFTDYYYDRGVEWSFTKASEDKGYGVVLNTKDKAFIPGMAVQDVEKGKLPGINPVPWQTDTSVSWRSWAYLKDDQLKDAGYLIRTLIDTVSRNGNLLLDIGPKPDGTISEQQEKILLQIGDWLKVNGEAIYGTRPWITYGEGPTQETGGKFSETDVTYQEGDVRFTWKGNALYIISMVPPAKSIEVSLLGKKAAPGTEIKEVSILGSNGKVQWQRDDNGLALSPVEKGGTLPVVYKVVLGGSMAGNLRIETLFKPVTSMVYVPEDRVSVGFQAHVELQNYNDQEVVQEADLLIGGKKVSSKNVTVGPQSSTIVDLEEKTRKSGLYEVSVVVSGQAPLTGRTVLPDMNLSGIWLFHTVDDASWSKPSLSEKGWQRVFLPAKWEDHGYKCEYCYGWYRKHFLVPKEWKGHSLVLPLGKIDDADVTYFNGKEIGGMGAFPPNFSTAWDKERHYEVPADLIHFGKDNVISIRVYNGSGGAGLYDGPLGPIEVK